MLTCWLVLEVNVLSARPAYWAVDIEWEWQKAEYQQQPAFFIYVYIEFDDN